MNIKEYISIVSRKSLGVCSSMAKNVDGYNKTDMVKELTTLK
jgi:hypothetical protein